MGKFFLMVLCFVTLGVFGAEEAAKAATDTGPFWFQPLLDVGVQVVLAILGVLVSIFVIFLKQKMNLKDAEAEALDALAVGVQDTYTTYIKRIRAGFADRKLTAEERSEAMQHTLETAKRIASGPALAFMKEKGEAWLKAKVEHLLISIKDKITKTDSAAPADKPE